MGHELNYTNSTMSEVILSVKNLSKSFGKRKAVDNLSFEIREGEIFGFLGPNGAGKSTAIRAMLSLIKLDNGDMILLIDVREPNEFNAGYIPGSVNIPRGTLEFKIGNEAFWDAAFLYLPETTEEIIVYCKKGKRGTLAAETLKKLGYENVTYIDGGWKEWEMNYPLLYEKNLDAMGHDDGGESGGC